jgi:hypothetical protein
MLNTLLFDEVGQHFPMGRKGGLIVPTDERISDTASTPLGLSLRVTPGAFVPLLEAGGTTMPTSSTSDGDDGEGTADNPDETPDETW